MPSVPYTKITDERLFKEVTDVVTDTESMLFGNNGFWVMAEMSGPEEQLVEDQTIQTYSGWSI